MRDEAGALGGSVRPGGPVTGGGPADAATTAAGPGRGRGGGHVPGEPGIWVLVLGDMVIFGVLFTLFSRARAHDPVLFAESQERLSTTIGLLNTVLLLASSYFVVRGVGAVRDGGPRQPARFFMAALACGLGFTVNKVLEYSGKLGHGITLTTNDFYMYYYVLTGIHALHLVLGMCVLVALIWYTRQPSRSPKIAIVEGCASYWHLVDVLWIVLFPLLYLI
ncbi:nitric oxide reductase NorE protein [Parafrankia irregularis]|uniref:Cytochrome aa3 subunit 3 n=1 Tax=Parafrankia irregularis TaxID=795642 RepID=A0A0S4QWX8_9ACTN|nr:MULTISPECIES: cytochrome c oxidase subunit 3 family protein [Parafrankia]MBE3200315.1 cytochrome c oxidase subunit 3 family protein [Parafrankia sp. CH37]CUU59721.1 nitric oxide reductase NorE protein [Parafrankia irregularis]